MSSYPKFEWILEVFRERNLLRQQRHAEAELFRGRFHEVMQEVVRPVLSEMAKLLREVGFDVKIGTLDAPPAPPAELPADLPLQSIALYIWPPGLPHGTPDDSTMQVRLVGNPVTQMVELTCVVASADWRGFHTLGMREVELASLSSAVVGQMVEQVAATALTLPY